MTKKQIATYKLVGNLLRAADKHALKVVNSDLPSTEHANLIEAFLLGASYILNQKKRKKKK